MHSYKCAGLGLVAALLVACQPALMPRVAGGVSMVGKRPAGAAVYQIEPGASSLQVLVYRAGPMAALGHDHVITNAALHGWIVAARSVAASSFQVDIPVAQFVVDDAAARRSAGPDFSEPVPADARAGTRAHMLGRALLDAARFPSIVVQSLVIRRTGPHFSARVAIRIAGRYATFDVPFVLVRSPKRLTASAAFDVRQTALGLTPYSVMMGALRVRDQVRVALKVVAVADPR